MFKVRFYFNIIFSLIAIVILFSACGNGGTDKDWKTPVRPDNIYFEEYGNLNVSKKHLTQKTGKPEFFNPPNDIKEITIKSTYSDMIFRQDSFNCLGQKIAAKHYSKGRFVQSEWFHYNADGWLDSITMQLEQNPVRLTSVFQYYELDGFNYKFSYSPKLHGKGMDTIYAYVEQFKYVDRPMSKVFHWRYGHNGKKIEYHYSSNGKLKALETFHGVKELKSHFDFSYELQNHKQLQTMTSDNGSLRFTYEDGMSKTGNTHWNFSGEEGKYGSDITYVLEYYLGNCQ